MRTERHRRSVRPYVIVWMLFGLAFGVATGLMLFVETKNVLASLAEVAACLLLAMIGGSIKYASDCRNF